MPQDLDKNKTPSIVHLKALDLRQVWPDEARDFTPWLAQPQNLNNLASSLNLHLDLIGSEVTLPAAGRVDILAEQVGTKSKVVIENQLNQSDDSHCLRLLGYAARAEANILIWVAESFNDYHCRILEWLNETDSIAVYAVEIKAYKAGDTITSSFNLVSKPPSHFPAVTNAKVNATKYFASFYQPIRQELLEKGLRSVGVGGYRGRWRSFQTGYPDIIYVSRVEESEVRVYLSIRNQEAVYKALQKYRSQIDASLPTKVGWHDEKDEWGHWFIIKIFKTRKENSSNDTKAIQQWIIKSLLNLRQVLEPFLNQVMEERGIPKEKEEIDKGANWES